MLRFVQNIAHVRHVRAQPALAERSKKLRQSRFDVYTTLLTHETAGFAAD
ncbi:hypothetical protein [Nocardia sp. CA-119907]